MHTYIYNYYFLGKLGSRYGPLAILLFRKIFNFLLAICQNANNWSKACHSLISPWHFQKPQIPCFRSLFRKNRFVLNENVQPNASKFAMFMKKENPCSFFHFSFGATLSFTFCFCSGWMWRTLIRIYEVFLDYLDVPACFMSVDTQWILLIL